MWCSSGVYMMVWCSSGVCICGVYMMVWQKIHVPLAVRCGVAHALSLVCTQGTGSMAARGPSMGV